MLDSLRSRFGFHSKSKKDDYDDEYYDDDYGEYGDSYDSDDYSYEGYGDDYAPDSTSSYSSSTSSSSRSNYPKLVSIEDVRANIAVPSSLNRDPLPPRHVTTASSSRTMVDSSLPPQMTPEGTAAEAAAASRKYTSGYDALFSSTTETPRQNYESSYSDSADSSSRSAKSSDYSTVTRKLVVVQPQTYNDAESVTKNLKLGNAVILSVKSVPSDLSKRLLDFSFGAASALDASVECIGDKIFAITRYKELSQSERDNLKKQGVI
ncbi:MAG: cell division protein SepF [Eggerthellaceae bacterium]|nr:cell division protein SepF [Eggerthellaceae bacterium]